MAKEVLSSHELLIAEFNLELVESIECDSNSIGFENSIKIYLNKPQVVNKWVAGSILLDLESYKTRIQNLITKFPHQEVEIREFISKSNKIFTNLKYSSIFDRVNSSLLIIPIMEPNQEPTIKYATINFTHLIRADTHKKTLDLYVDKQKADRSSPQIKWLIENLMPKLKNWSLNVNQDLDSNCAKANTLTLYHNMVNDYVNLYQELKTIYWNKFSNIWFSLTNTDPEKYIHEDISIATYFILVWRHFKTKVRNFVDLGCGNGLLVFILNDQGFNGYGVDMRKRRLWTNDFYSKSNIKLVEKTINPSLEIYPDCDWLIGNHSDELSPWIPIIARKSANTSKLECNFILIPCCFFDFNSKFELKKKNESRYETYLDYLEKISTLTGVKCFKDKLRIPSTRNVCFISQTLSENEFEAKEDDKKLKEAIEKLITETEMVEFKAREMGQENARSSRNCTKNVELETRNLIVRTVIEHLLKNDCNDCIYLDRYDGSKWNSGRAVKISDLANLFDQETLNKLKLECGGLKTLLKNYHQLFEVIDRDKVKLKIWRKNNEEQTNIANIANISKNKIVKKSNKPVSIKTKQCLFDLLHPNGCWLKNEDCNFLHQDK